MNKRNGFVTLSVLVHGALAFAVGEIRQAKSKEIVAIQMAEVARKKPEPAKVEPEPPRPERARPTANRRPAAPPKPAAEPPRAAPQSEALDALPDFGVALSGGVNGTGLALPSANGGPTSSRVKPVVRQPAPVAQDALGGCDEPITKPKPRVVPQPAYTEQARAAAVQGKVRVQLTVDATGRVIDVRVLQGLGYGLDEAALTAARQASFEPAVRCGSATQATFTISMRFTL